MGLYDTVTFRCPGCGERFSDQTKAGSCTLSDYEQDRVPLAIAANMQGDFVNCLGCGKEWRIRTDAPTTARLSLVEP